MFLIISDLDQNFKVEIPEHIELILRLPIGTQIQITKKIICHL